MKLAPFSLHRILCWHCLFWNAHSRAVINYWWCQCSLINFVLFCLFVCTIFVHEILKLCQLYSYDMLHELNEIKMIREITQSGTEHVTFEWGCRAESFEAAGGINDSFWGLFEALLITTFPQKMFLKFQFILEWVNRSF